MAKGENIRMTFEEWKAKHDDEIVNVATVFFNYERGVDTRTCYDELEWLLRKAFISGQNQCNCLHNEELEKENAELKETIKKIEKVFYSGENAIKRLSKISDILAEMEKGICDICKETEKDKQIADLEKENKRLQEQIVKMRRCENCRYKGQIKNCTYKYYERCAMECKSYSLWEAE